MKAILLSVLLLAGCATNPFVRTEVVVQTEYVVRRATDAQKALPPMPPTLNVKTATQSDLAQWIVDNEQRQLALESVINRLIEFYEAPPPAPAASAAK